MDKVHVIYGSTTGTTEAIAERVASDFGTVALNVNAVGPEALEAELLILGTSTWGFGDLQDDWVTTGLGLIEGANLQGRRVALFGLGDSQGFADTFCDGMAALAEAVTARGATLVGTLPLDAFAGVTSKIAQDGHLVGLALDELNESDKTEGRLTDWEALVRSQAGLSVA
mgnify:FL=1